MMTKKKYNESPDSFQSDELSLDIGLVADKFAASIDKFKFLSSKAHAILAPLNINRSQNFYFSDISQTILKLKQNVEKIKDVSVKYNNAFTSKVLHDNYFTPEQNRQIKSEAINGYLIERKTELDKGFLFDESVIDKFRSLNSQFNTQLEECIQRIDLKFNPMLLKEKHFNKIRWYNIEIKTSFWSKLHKDRKSVV